MSWMREGNVPMRPRPFDWLGRLRAHKLRRQAQLLAQDGRTHQALVLLHRAVRCCQRTRRATYFQMAEILRAEAASAQDVRAAIQLYRRVAARAGGPLAAQARERLILLACQQRRDATAAALLSEAGYKYRLHSQIVAYPALASTPPQPTPSPKGFAHCVDGALPLGMLRALQHALAPDSAFWREHRYRCGKSPFFSYVHALSGPPRTGMDRILRLVHAQAARVFPTAADAQYAEWWAHCRPHATGHQFHYDSDDEGRGGVRNPTVSSALYLTGSVGGPTLVTDHRIGVNRLASRGWAALPAENRLLLFDGGLLHGVIPGRGSPQGASGDGSTHGRAARRISLMVAFWPSIRQRHGGRQGAARPIPPLAGTAQPTAQPTAVLQGSRSM